MASSQQCQIKLLNKTYHIKCAADQVETLHLAADKINKLMQQKKQQFPLLDDNKLLLLAALEIAHQQTDKQKPSHESKSDINDLIHHLENRINHVME